VGADDHARQGALRYLDEDGQPFPTPHAPVPRLTELEALKQVAARYERNPAGAEAEARELAGAAGSLGGARPKVSVRDGNDLWIAKFTSMDDTWPVERLEVATLNLARDAGIRVPEVRLELAASDRPVALIKRFDRRDGGRVPYISARTALGKVGNATGSYTDIADVLTSLSVSAAQDIRELWCRMVFGMLVTNTDDHLKNHGLIYVRSNRWRLSPMFDVNPQPHQHPQMETAISPIHGSTPSITAAIEASPFFGIEHAEARALARDMARRLHEGWRSELRGQGISGRDLAACAPAFEHERMEEALSL
jgi:serine/threonine-protein kinase HipA